VWSQNFFHNFGVQRVPGFGCFWFGLVLHKLERSLLLLKEGLCVERRICFGGVAEEIIESFQLGGYVSLLLWCELTDVTVENNLFDWSSHVNSLCLLSVRDCCFVSKCNNFSDSSLDICSFC
jgi:hypothetical protein